LEDANVKLTEAISDVLGVSGRAMLNAFIAGETDPERLADSCLSGCFSRPPDVAINRRRGA
jgi:transposase